VSGAGRHDAYRSAGVDYDALDAGKRLALTHALATSPALLAHPGGRAVDSSRGEPAFVFQFAGQTLAFVLEGLGTKSVIARLVQEELGENHFAAVAYDTVAAIVNDLVCVGALPLVVNAYFATGSSAWYGQAERQSALLDGWQRACQDAGATWGGGESPSLPGLVSELDIELAGCAVGAVPQGAGAILGEELAVGDEIVFVASSGLHANGASLARMVADSLTDGYATRLPGGESFGEALLTPAFIYAPLVAALLAGKAPIHYLSHITGHGFLKLMRPSREFTYRITELPEVPPVLGFLVERAGMPPDAAYSTFNMGCGFAIYCAAGSGTEIVEIARSVGLAAQVGGRLEEGPRRVIIPAIDVTFTTDAMDLTPKRVA
jgi:phosphoribosylformylglycinamidine cyclo-ligase